MRKKYQYNYNEAAYLEAAQSYSIIVWTSGKKVVLCRPLKNYQSKLSADGWCRIHRSYMVNPLFVKQISEDKDFIYLNSGLALPISRRLKRHVLKWREQTI
jgi:DNA-binding LytR/AlgR family response regulator